MGPKNVYHFRRYSADCILLLPWYLSVVENSVTGNVARIYRTVQLVT